eukprot:g20187.t1
MLSFESRPTATSRGREAVDHGKADELNALHYVLAEGLAGAGADWIRQMICQTSALNAYTTRCALHVVFEFGSHSLASKFVLNYDGGAIGLRGNDDIDMTLKLAIWDGDPSTLVRSFSWMFLEEGATSFQSMAGRSDQLPIRGGGRQALSSIHEGQDEAMTPVLKKRRVEADEKTFAVQREAVASGAEKIAEGYAYVLACWLADVPVDWIRDILDQSRARHAYTTECKLHVVFAFTDQREATSFVKVYDGGVVGPPGPDNSSYDRALHLTPWGGPTSGLVLVASTDEAAANVVRGIIESERFCVLIALCIAGDWRGEHVVETLRAANLEEITATGDVYMRHFPEIAAAFSVNIALRGVVQKFFASPVPDCKTIAMEISLAESRECLHAEPVCDDANLFSTAARARTLNSFFEHQRRRLRAVERCASSRKSSDASFSPADLPMRGLLDTCILTGVDLAEEDAAAPPVTSSSSGGQHQLEDVNFCTLDPRLPADGGQDEPVHRVDWNAGWVDAGVAVPVYRREGVTTYGFTLPEEVWEAVRVVVSGALPVSQEAKERVRKAVDGCHFVLQTKAKFADEEIVQRAPTAVYDCIRARVDQSLIGSCGMHIKSDNADAVVLWLSHSLFAEIPPSMSSFSRAAPLPADVQRGTHGNYVSTPCMDNTIPLFPVAEHDILPSEEYVRACEYSCKVLETHRSGRSVPVTCNPPAKSSLSPKRPAEHASGSGKRRCVGFGAVERSAEEDDGAGAVCLNLLNLEDKCRARNPSTAIDGKKKAELPSSAVAQKMKTMKSGSANTGCHALPDKSLHSEAVNGGEPALNAADMEVDAGAKAAKDDKVVKKGRRGASTGNISSKGEAKAPPAVNKRRRKVMKTNYAASSKEGASAIPGVSDVLSATAVAASSSRKMLVGGATRPEQLRFQYPLLSHDATFEDRKVYKTKGVPVFNPVCPSASAPAWKYKNQGADVMKAVGKDKNRSRVQKKASEDLFVRKISGDEWKQLQKPENKLLRDRWVSGEMKYQKGIAEENLLGRYAESDFLHEPRVPTDRPCREMVDPAGVMHEHLAVGYEDELEPIFVEVSLLQLMLAHIAEVRRWTITSHPSASFAAVLRDPSAEKGSEWDEMGRCWKNRAKHIRWGSSFAEPTVVAKYKQHIQLLPTWSGDDVTVLILALISALTEVAPSDDEYCTVRARVDVCVAAVREIWHRVEVSYPSGEKLTAGEVSRMNLSLYRGAEGVFRGLTHVDHLHLSACLRGIISGNADAYFSSSNRYGDVWQSLEPGISFWGNVLPVLDKFSDEVVAVTVAENSPRTFITHAVADAVEVIRIFRAIWPTGILPPHSLFAGDCGSGGGLHGEHAKDTEGTGRIPEDEQTYDQAVDVQSKVDCFGHLVGAEAGKEIIRRIFDHTALRSGSEFLRQCRRDMYWFQYSLRKEGHGWCVVAACELAGMPSSVREVLDREGAWCLNPDGAASLPCKTEVLYKRRAEEARVDYSPLRFASRLIWRDACSGSTVSLWNQRWMWTAWNDLHSVGASELITLATPSSRQRIETIMRRMLIDGEQSPSLFPDGWWLAVNGLRALTSTMADTFVLDKVYGGGRYQLGYGAEGGR